jgi:hypothetical protein
MSGMDQIIAIHGVFLSNLRSPLLIRKTLPLRRGFGPCLPAGRRVDGNQRDFEGEGHPIILSCTWQS